MQKSNLKYHPEAFKKTLDELYVKYNRRSFVTPDPLQFLYDYADIRDREIVGLVAASLAYGRVAQILTSVSGILAMAGNSPYEFVMQSDRRRFRNCFQGFCHRFAKRDQLVALFSGIRQVIDEFGSLQSCFNEGMAAVDDTVYPAMHFFVERLVAGNNDPGHLVSLPWKKSACKRLNLFLRWMARKDRVDPGGWERVSPAKLIIPLDTHIHKISLALGFTNRKQANLITAIEITEKFKQLNPPDPVKYDFVLSRFGIRHDMNIVDLIEEF
ncbi:MAG: TIGR02757 family protein [Proteobacteria bacterium]|nr:TIGR02757 family protein [Pseudomonadota bacterium]